MKLGEIFLHLRRVGGPSCRRCSEPIHGRDAFGVSELVCRPCRES